MISHAEACLPLSKIRESIAAKLVKSDEQLPALWSLIEFDLHKDSLKSLKLRLVPASGARPECVESLYADVPFTCRARQWVAQHWCVPSMRCLFALSADGVTGCAGSTWPWPPF